MRCNFRIVYGLKTAYSIRTNRTDWQSVIPPINQITFSNRVRIENGLYHPYEPYESTARDTPFVQVRREIYPSVRTVRIDMICQTPLTQAKVKYILSPINEIQFSDRVQFETGQFHPYGPYSATTFTRTVQIETGNFQTVSDCVYWTTLD